MRWKSLKDVLSLRLKTLNLQPGINEQTVLALTEDFLTQNDFYFCFPKSFRMGCLTIWSSKSVMANELENNKAKIIEYLKKECSDIKVETILIKIGYTNKHD